MAYSVSISSSYKDRDLARDVARRVKEAGFSVTSEVTLSAGSEYEKIIMDQLKNADEIIVILSGNSVDNLWMMFEIGAASSLRKKITPVFFGLEQEELPPVIKQLKYIRYNEVADYISKLERGAQAA